MKDIFSHLRLGTPSYCMPETLPWTIEKYLFNIYTIPLYFPGQLSDYVAFSTSRNIALLIMLCYSTISQQEFPFTSKGVALPLNIGYWHVDFMDTSSSILLNIFIIEHLWLEFGKLTKNQKPWALFLALPVTSSIISQVIISVGLTFPPKSLKIKT